MAFTKFTDSWKSGNEFVEVTEMCVVGYSRMVAIVDGGCWSRLLTGGAGRDCWRGGGGGDAGRDCDSDSLPQCGRELVDPLIN